MGFIIKKKIHLYSFNFNLNEKFLNLEVYYMSGMIMMVQLC